MSIKKYLVAVYGMLVAYYTMLVSHKRQLNNFGASASGGVAIILIIVSVFVGALVGLMLTPDIAEASLEASWSFNNTTYEAIMYIFYQMVIPILWACIMIAIMGGAGVGVYRVASRL